MSGFDSTLNEMFTICKSATAKHEHQAHAGHLPYILLEIILLASFTRNDQTSEGSSYYAGQGFPVMMSASSMVLSYDMLRKMHNMYFGVSEGPGEE